MSMTNGTAQENASAWLCHGTRSGVVAVDAVVDTERSMLLRVGGPHPQTVLFRRANQLSSSTWMAEFQICDEGTYTFFVLDIMPNPWPGDNAQGDPFDSGKQAAWLRASNTSCFTPYERTPGNWLRYFSWQIRTSTGCEVQSRQLWSWRAPRSAERAAILQKARDSLSTPQLAPHPWKHQLNHMFGELVWAGRDPLNSSWPTFAASGRLPVCMVGDSTVRNLHNALLRQTTGIPACDVIAAQETHAVCNESASALRRTLKYVVISSLPPPFTITGLSSSLDRLFGKTGSALQGCGAIAVNVGQWIAAGFAGRPWTPATYRRIASGMLDWLRRTGAHLGVPVAWMATQPFPLNKGGHGHGTDQSNAHRRSSNLIHCPPTDWRYPHVLQAYNLGVQAAARERNVAIIDLWTAAMHVFELSFDDLHYATGPLGNLHAALVVEWVLQALPPSDKSVHV
jgi:hypothetical protein